MTNVNSKSGYDASEYGMETGSVPFQRGEGVKMTEEPQVGTSLAQHAVPQPGHLRVLSQEGIGERPHAGEYGENQPDFETVPPDAPPTQVVAGGGTSLAVTDTPQSMETQVPNKTVAEPGKPLGSGHEARGLESVPEAKAEETDEPVYDAPSDKPTEEPKAAEGEQDKTEAPAEVTEEPKAQPRKKAARKRVVAQEKPAGAGAEDSTDKES